MHEHEDSYEAEGAPCALDGEAKAWDKHDDYVVTWYLRLKEGDEVIVRTGSRWARTVVLIATRSFITTESGAAFGLTGEGVRGIGRDPAILYEDNEENTVALQSAGLRDACVRLAEEAVAQHMAGFNALQLKDMIVRISTHLMCDAQ